MKEPVASIIMIIVIILLGAFVLYLSGGLVKKVMTYNEGQRAVAECEKWIDWAKVYPDFFLTQWQYDQCSANGITIDTKILK